MQCCYMTYLAILTLYEIWRRRAGPQMDVKKTKPVAMKMYMLKYNVNVKTAVSVINN